MYIIKQKQNWTEWEFHLEVTTPDGEMEVHENLESMVEYYELTQEDMFDFYDILNGEKTHKGYKVKQIIHEDEHEQQNTSPRPFGYNKKTDAFAYVTSLRKRYCAPRVSEDSDGKEITIEPKYAVLKNKLGKKELINYTFVALDTVKAINNTRLNSINVTLSKK